MTMKMLRLFFGAVFMLLITGIPSYTQNQIRPLNNLAVYDGDGKKIGNVINFWGEPSRGAYVAFSAGQSSFLLTFFSYGVAGFDNILYFASTDCTGDPFFSSSGRERIFPYSGVKKGIIYQAKPVDSRRVNVRSTWHAPEEICQTFVNSVDVIPAIPLIDISTIFKPPFTVQ